LLVGFQYVTIPKYQTCVSGTGCESTVISVSSLLETGCSRLTAASINSPDKLCMTLSEEACLFPVYRCTHQEPIPITILHHIYVQPIDGTITVVVDIDAQK
jgi:hypothetical protein